MTGPGTNTYLLGRKELAVVDPGPLIDSHVQAILAGARELGGEIKHVFVTHTHPDHSPACEPLVAATRARRIGMPSEDDTFRDDGFRADYLCSHDEVFEGDGYRLRAVHTPGHVDNHFCFLEEVSGLLMAGDHIMNGSTVVIVPPGGDMAKYIRSLQVLLHYPITHIAPAHGDLMADPHRVIDGLVQHRLAREAKVLQALAENGPATLKSLVKFAYDDVDSALHPIARYSLWAHLLKLGEEGLATEEDEHWRLLAR